MATVKVFPLEYVVTLLSICCIILGLFIGDVTAEDDSAENPNAGKNPSCIPENCFAPLHDCKKEKADKSRIHFYNEKTLKCETTKKCGPEDENMGELLFDTKADCEDICKFCPTVLKHYKSNDPCLIFVLSIKDGDEGKPSTPVTFWKFSVPHGTCIKLDGEFRPGFKAEKGMIFMSEKECNKRCPNLP